jgi:hypothetical protein
VTRDKELQAIIASQAKSIATLLAAQNENDANLTNKVLRSIIADRDRVIEGLLGQLEEERSK